MNRDRLFKAIKFFREFGSKADSFLYRKSVERFCTLVEEHLLDCEKPDRVEEQVKEAEGIFQ